MHLRDRCARHGLSFEFLENLRDRLAERSLDLGQRELTGKRRHAVLQLRELVGKVRGQEVAARREHLAELHEDRAERFERQAQPHPARLAQRPKEKERIQSARQPAPRSERELVQPEAQGYPEDLGETKQGGGSPQGEAANLPELAGPTRERNLPSSGPCAMRKGVRCVCRAEPRRRAACRRRGRKPPRRWAARAEVAPRSSTRRGFRQGAGRLRAATPQRPACLRRGGALRRRRTPWKDPPRNPS